MKKSIIWEKLEGKKIIIYGTGHVAHMFYKAILEHGLQETIQCFVRSESVGRDELFEGVPICSIKDVCIEYNTLICLAVHESIRDEIQKIVNPITNQYLWIYPYLFELMLGEPVQRAVEVSVAQLLGGCQNDLRLAIRLAAIEQQAGMNTFGFDYYVRAQMLHCSKDTATKRLKQFAELISEWKQFGYKKENLIVLNSDYDVIDGIHRLTMAVYMGQKTIFGDIYAAALSAKDIHGPEVMLSEEELLLSHGFTQHEIQQLAAIQQRYLKAYEN